MREQAAYKIDRDRIIFEQFDDETVLVNSETGCYYSLSNTGSEILRILEDGFTVEELMGILFETSSDIHRLRTSIEKFIVQLEDEGIILPRTVDRSSRKTEAEAQARHGRGIHFASPTLDRFDDMRELLLIDPVHQVDQEYGWPFATNIGDRSADRK